MHVHAYSALAAKQPLQPFVYQADTLGDYEVEVRISYCGICHSDIHLIDNDWGVTKYPLVPGHEIIGQVTAKGSRVTKLEVGQRVGIGWQESSCLECEWCASGQEQLCAENRSTAVGHFGGFAESVRAHAHFVFPIPEVLASENAAPLLCAGLTVYSPLRNNGVLPHHRVGVAGIGGLGHIAIQFAAAMGCEVTAFSNSPNKEAEAKSFGAARFISSSNKAEMAKAVRSLDFILSTVTAPLDWNQFIQALRPNGKLCFLGGMAGMLTIPVGLLLSGQRSVTGSMIGGRAMMLEMLDFAARNGIEAKTEVMPMAKVNAAIDKVRENKARYRMVLQA